MAYYTKHTDRMDIHIEESRGTILIKQKWKYNWLTGSNTTSWTLTEKREFHNKIDNLIWNNWGKYFFLKVSGSSKFSEKHKNKKWDVNFDIEWVLSGGHWRVNAKKIIPNSYQRSNVNWNSRTVNIDTEDTRLIKRIRQRNKYFQYPIVHEFGHAAGNSTYSRQGMHGDEYNQSSNHFRDKKSIMNIGNKLRDRHLDYIIFELNTMIPNTEFKKF